jgi:hypothetical protein
MPREAENNASRGVTLLIEIFLRAANTVLCGGGAVVL